MKSVASIILIISILLVFLSGCSSPISDVDKHSLDLAITEHLGGNNPRQVGNYFDVVDVEILEVEKTGTKLNPTYQGAFRAKVKLLVDTYESPNDWIWKENRLRYATNFRSVSKVGNKGDTSLVTGRFSGSTTGLSADGKPIVAFYIEDLDVVQNRWSGYPLQTYGSKWAGETDLKSKAPYIVIIGTTDFDKAKKLVSEQINLYEKQKLVNEISKEVTNKKPVVSEYSKSDYMSACKQAMTEIQCICYIEFYKSIGLEVTELGDPNKVNLAIKGMDPEKAKDMQKCRG